MEIQNEIKEKPRKSTNINGEDDGEEKKFKHRSLTDVQRAKLDKLMANPDKPIIIPEIPKERDFTNSAPTFVRNVMGSSAGAGSGEFHVYRNLRRKEYARMRAIEAKSRQEEMEDEFRAKLEQNKLDAEEKTAKKRAKRQKKKLKMKNKKPKMEKKESSSSEDLGESDPEEVKKDEDQEVPENTTEESSKENQDEPQKEEDKMDESATDESKKENQDEPKKEEEKKDETEGKNLS